MCTDYRLQGPESLKPKEHRICIDCSWQGKTQISYSAGKEVEKSIVNIL